MVLDDPVMSDFMCSRPSSTGAGQGPPPSATAAAAASASSAPPSKPAAAAAASVPPPTTSGNGGRLGKKKVRDRLQHRARAAVPHARGASIHE
jgi:hypothetical protein